MTSAGLVSCPVVPAFPLGAPLLSLGHPPSTTPAGRVEEVPSRGAFQQGHSHGLAIAALLRPSQQPHAGRFLSGRQLWQACGRVAKGCELDWWSLPASPLPAP